MSENRRLRIMHVVSQLDTGGLEKLLVEFARHADRTKFELYFVSLTTRGAIANELEALGWPVEHLGAKQGLRLSTCLGLIRLFRNREIDVVHAHNTKPVIYCGLAKRLAGVPRLVYTRHGQRFGASVRGTLLFRLAVRSVDSVVCVSEDAARLSIAEGLPANKIRSIWNGVDTDRFQMAGPASTGPAVMVGRLSPEKDVETLLRAAAIVLESHKQFRLEIAGDGPVLSDMRLKAAELGIAHAVSFLGRVENVAALLQRASMSVISSITEGISMTLLEAMARGLPTVATSVGGNPEIIVNGKTGLLVSARDPAKLADAMLTLIRDPARAREMGQAGHQRVKSLFDARRMVSRYESIYSGAVSDAINSPLPLTAGNA